MKLILENWRGYLTEQDISYSGVVLDQESQQRLLDLPVPEGWESIAHHMTITMGPLIHKKGKHDFSETYPAGSSIELPVVSVGQDDRAMAVRITPPHPVKSKSFPHITVAVNREGGGKPVHSNEIPEENFTALDGLVLRGVVEEIPRQ